MPPGGTLTQVTAEAFSPEPGREKCRAAIDAWRTAN
jgi:hypothetical protein